MSRRMSSSLWPRLWIVWSLLFAASLRADPPQAEQITPIVSPVRIVLENGLELEAESLTLTSRDLKPDQPAQQIQFNVTVWDVDHAALRALTKSDLGVHEFYKANGLIKQPDWISAAIGDAADKLLTPPGHKVAAPRPLPLRAVAVRSQPVLMTLLGKEISSACERISEPTVVTINGQDASIQVGSEVPAFVPRAGESDVVDFHEIGLKLKIRQRLLDNNRIAMALDFAYSELNEPKVEAKDSSVTLIDSRGFQLSTRMKLGERLLVAQQTDKQDVTRLVQIQPELHANQPVAETPNTPAIVLPNPPTWPDGAGSAAPQLTAKSLSANNEFIVEDRWPIHDIKVGQQVTLVPLSIGKTSVTADMNLFLRAAEGDWPMRVTQVKPLPGSTGRRVTFTMPNRKGVEEQKFFAKFWESVRSASSTCVVSVSNVSVTELLDPRVLREIVEHIPAESRPRPQEMTVGETFVAFGVITGRLLDGELEGEKDRHEIGPFSLELLDGDTGCWRVTATKVGVTRLVQITMNEGKTFNEPARFTEYLVKADTRELEHHIRQQFPTGKVTVTSVGANSLMLSGTVASEEDSRGIVELAEQFAPKVLNRLKAGAGERAAADDARRMGTPARPVELTAANDSEETGKSAHPPKRITPAAVKAPNKSDQLQQLRDELRELRQEVRVLIQRLDREQAATPTNSSDANSSRPIPETVKADQLPLQSATVGITENDLRIARQLVTVVELDANELPLAKVVEQLARQANINIVFDKAGLEEAGVTAATPVTRMLKGVKLRSALKIVLEPLKLSHAIDGEVLKVTSQQRAAGPLVVVAYPVADLLTDTHSNPHVLRDLQELVCATVPPESQWQDTAPRIYRNEATKTLFVRQPVAIHDQVRDFLELLRKTAHATHSGDTVTSLPKPTDEERRIKQQLDKTVSMEFTQPTPLGEAIKQLARLADFNIVLDQTGLAEEDLKVTTLVTLQVRDVRLSTALRLLLEPLNLDSVVKNEVLQITSRRRAAGQLTVATYPVADLLARENDKSGDLSDLCDLLMTMIEPDSWDIVGGQAAVKWNATTQSLVVRQTPANHARIRVLLETLWKAGNQTAESAPRQTSATDANTKNSQSPNDWQAVTEKRDGKYNPNNFDQQLAMKVSVDFENAPLSKVIEHLAGVAKVNIQLDAAGLKDESITATTPVSLKVSEITLRSALALLLEPLNLGFFAEANGITVTSQQRVQGRLLLATYSVADLVIIPIETPEVKPPMTDQPQLNAKAPQVKFEELVDLIRATVAPDSWSEAGGVGQIKAHPGTLSLVIHQTQAVHNEIRDLLEQLRRLQDLQVSLELHILKFDEGFPGVGSSLPLDWNKTSAEKPLVLTSADATALLKAANGENRNSVFQSPKVTLFNGQRASLSLSNDEESPLGLLRVTATNVISPDRQFVRVSLASDTGAAKHSTTTTVRDGHSLLLNMTDAANNGTQTGIPILSKVSNVDRLFKNVSKPTLKSGESLFLLATPRVIVLEASDTSAAVDSVDPDAKRRSASLAIDELEKNKVPEPAKNEAPPEVSADPS